MAEAPKAKKSSSAEKRARQSLKRQARNAAIKSSLKTINKRFLAAVAAGDKNEAEALYKDSIRAFDKAVSKNVIHLNKASRKKSRLAHRLAEMATAKPATKKGAAKKG